MPDQDGYPTDKELKIIKEWNCKDPFGLIDFIEQTWWAADWGFRLSGKKIKRLELHTGGWSGNEDIIIALQNNYMFWSLYWEKSTRGGHYWFKIYELKQK